MIYLMFNPACGLSGKWEFNFAPGVVATSTATITFRVYIEPLADEKFCFSSTKITS